MRCSFDICYISPEIKFNREKSTETTEIANVFYVASKNYSILKHYLFELEMK